MKELIENFKIELCGSLQIPKSYLGVNKFVKFRKKYDRIITDDMKKWIEKNNDKEFKIERESRMSVKLYGVDFWVTKDLLYIV
jgi:hypothetical protein